MRNVNGKTVRVRKFLSWHRSENINAVNSASGVSSAKMSRWLKSIHGAEPIIAMVNGDPIFVNNDSFFELANIDISVILTYRADV